MKKKDTDEGKRERERERVRQARIEEDSNVLFVFGSCVYFLS